MRIRTVKPEFWDDETIGLLSRDARLLYIALFNIADDEGLLRWTPPFIKSKAFVYDDDLDVDDVARLMAELVTSGRVFAYEAGQVNQKLAVVIQFRRHQKINRPQPSKLPPPPLQQKAVRRMYACRDGWTCHLCNGVIVEVGGDDRRRLSVGHIKSRPEGGTDHPSNVHAAHLTCSNELYDDSDGDDGESFTPGEEQPNTESMNGSRSDSVNDSVNAALPFGEDFTAGRDQGRDQGKEENLSLTALDERFPDFWKTYPRKVDKQAALRAWRAALRRGSSASHIVTAAGDYAEARRGQDPKFTKHPATWLNAAAYDNGSEERHLRAVSGGYQPWQNPADDSVYLQEF